MTVEKRTKKERADADDRGAKTRAGNVVRLPVYTLPRKRGEPGGRATTKLINNNNN